MPEIEGAGNRINHLTRRLSNNSHKQSEELNGRTYLEARMSWASLEEKKNPQTAFSKELLKPLPQSIRERRSHTIEKHENDTIFVTPAEPLTSVVPLENLRNRESYSFSYLSQVVGKMFNFPSIGGMSSC
jgi:hypothetical protein